MIERLFKLLSEDERKMHTELVIETINSSLCQDGLKIMASQDYPNRLNINPEKKKKKNDSSQPHRIPVTVFGKTYRSIHKACTELDLNYSTVMNTSKKKPDKTVEEIIEYMYDKGIPQKDKQTEKPIQLTFGGNRIK